MSVSVLLGSLGPTTDAAHPPPPGGWRGPTKFGGQIVATSKLGRDWAEVVVQLPAQSRPARAALYLQLGGAVGKVWFDDVVLLANSTTSSPGDSRGASSSNSGGGGATHY